MMIGLLRHEEWASRVQAEDSIELLFCHIVEMAEAHDFRVANGNVKLTEVGDSLVEKFDRLRYV